MVAVWYCEGSLRCDIVSGCCGTIEQEAVVMRYSERWP